MSATRPRRSTHALYDDLAASLRSQLADAAELITKRDAVIKHLRKSYADLERELKSYKDVRLELLEELRDYRSLYPHVRGWEGCDERPKIPWTDFSSD